MVGKNISETGQTLLGHNEDNSGRLVMLQYIVPAASHNKNEMIQFEKDTAEIPQVPHTNRLFWSETRASWSASFSDFYANECGVAIVSNSCRPSRENAATLRNGGIKYGLRRIVAERAKTAREAVVLAIKLVEKYGYNSSGRTYTFADKDEGWMLQIVKGTHCLARKIKPDEIAFIPNHYTIHEIDFNKLLYSYEIDNIEEINDKKYDDIVFIASKNIVEYAIEKGWYTPSGQDNYNDFDFARVYQDPSGYAAEGNVLRQKHALEIIIDNLHTALEYDLNKDLPFAVKISQKSYHKATVELLKSILRHHYEGTLDDLTSRYRESSLSPHDTGKRAICSYTTQESIIIQFREDPKYTVMWKTTGHPCTSPYVPWYLGITEIPDGYGWIDADIGLKTHFEPPLEDLSYNPERSWWAFMDVQNIVEPQYGKVILQLKNNVSTLEKEWSNDFKNDNDLKKIMTAPQLTEYTHHKVEQARNWTKETFSNFSNVKIYTKDDFIYKDVTDGEIAITILSSDDLVSSSVIIGTVKFGPGFLPISARVPAEERTLQDDINGDGINDSTFYFKKKLLVSDLAPCLTDFWLSGRTETGEYFAAKLLLNVLLGYKY